MPNTQEYYVAFSIHGTSCFITANIVTDKADISGQKVVIDGFSFTKGQSRDGSSKRSAQKLLSPDLRSGNNQPLTNARDIHAYFLKLRENGWTVDDKAFIKKHDLTEIVPPVTQVETPKPEAKTDFQAETPPGRTDETPTQIEELPAPTGDNPAQPELEDSEKPYYPEPGSVDDGTYEGNEAERAIAAHRKEQEKTTDKPVFERLDGSVKAVQGDITKFEADGIVNAANAQLIPGGGVDGAINRAAGPELAEAMAIFKGCPTGCAVVTDAFGLQTTKHIIHAVGPIYKEYLPREAAEHLKGAYLNAFAMALGAGCKTVGVPLLSTGVYGYPMAEACAIAVQAARAFNKSDNAALDITFVAFDDAAFAAIQEALSKPSHE